MKTKIISLLLLFGAASATFGQVPSTLSYQGRVQVSGTNFSGNGLFKFALVSDGTNLNRQATATATVTSGFITSISVTDGGSGYETAPIVTIADSTGSGATATAQISDGSVTSITVNNAGNGYSAPTVVIGAPTAGPVYGTYWSNDGSSTAGHEPASAVSVSVSQGLFTILLGDATLPNMTPVPASTFSQPVIYLRTWFNDGVNGFIQLSPDQPISSVAYAMVAAQFHGPVADSQLPANVARLDGSNQTFTGSVNFSSQSSAFAGTFTGNGAGITNVNLATIDSAGAIAVDRRLLFFLSSSPFVGTGSRSVTAADINSDGRVDLISANPAADTLSVLTNNRSGGFALAATLGAGDNPVWVITADVNGDGRPDLISADEFSFTLSVLTNTGGGSFSLASSPGVATYPRAVAAADLNGDGHIDLVSAHASPDVLTVLTNNGRGAFTLSSSPTTGSSPICVAVADINADGRIDLISANYSGDTLSVLTNNGNGSFILSSSPAVGPNPNTVVATDLNGDGRSDLVSVNQFNSTLSVLTNNGTGTFALASSPSVGSAPHGLTTADLNGDGYSDLVSADLNASTLSVLTNRGAGLFGPAATLPVGASPHGTAVADVDRDGYLDLISANLGANTLSVYTQNPDNLLVAFNGNFSGTFSGNAGGSFSGNGSGLTNLNASNLTSGTVADARLSANVARRSGGNAFTGTQTITSGNLGIGTSPSVALHVAGTAQTMAVIDSTQPAGTWLGIENSSTGGQRWSIISTGSGNGEGAGRLLFFTSQSNDTKMRLEPTGNLIIDGTLTQSSDRNRKENFTRIGAQEILNLVAALPITRWNYKDDPGAEHIGPMAQDFKASFGLGSEETSIASVDADGVALAAIQGLNQKLEEQLKRKDSEIHDLKDRLAQLEKLIHSLAPPR